MTARVLGILIGVGLLLLGRQLYWLYVAGVGFVVALDLMTRLVQIEPTLLILVIALVVGAFGALLAIFLQKTAIGLAGFFAGGYMLLTISDSIGLQTGPAPWILALVGGVIGLVLTLMLFEWALIILSSLAGAGVIARSLNATRAGTGGLFLALFAVGVVVQAMLLSRRSRWDAGGAE
ncbi:MAG: hypothetical protein R6V13_11720 [Anaerolineae bacterium]